MSNKIKTMMDELKALFAEVNPEGAVVAFDKATLKDGTIITWEGELAEGTAILVESPDGNIAAPDATHELENGTLVTTVNGLVTSIVPFVETEIVTVEEDLKSEVTELRSVVSNLETVVAKFASQLEAKDNEIKQLKDSFKKTVELVEAVANLPQEDPTEVLTPEAKNRYEKERTNVAFLRDTINKTVNKK
jgi:C4-type Zn-finger protein